MPYNNNYYVEPPQDHWFHSNVHTREWGPEECTKYIESQTNGHDIIRPTGPYILMKRIHPPEKAGGLKLPSAQKEAMRHEIYLGRILDWGPRAFLEKMRYPEGNVFCRNDVAFYHTLEHRRVEVKIDEDGSINVPEFDCTLNPDAAILLSLPSKKEIEKDISSIKNEIINHNRENEAVIKAYDPYYPIDHQGMLHTKNPFPIDDDRGVQFLANANLHGERKAMNDKLEKLEYMLLKRNEDIELVLVYDDKLLGKVGDPTKLVTPRGF